MNTNPLHRVDVRQVARHYSSLPVEARELVRLCDGTRDLPALAMAAALPLERAAAIVTRLSQLGVLAGSAPAASFAAAEPAMVEPAMAEPAMAEPALSANDFTEEEERFFAGAIDHLLEE